MIYLPEIAEKLEELLNGSGSNGYNYVVATSGFHLDKNYTKKEGNFIPVFIDSAGGSYDAVPNLKRVTRNISVVIYFPVRLKEDFFALNDFLEDTFIATTINFGTNTGSCLCNISPADYGEIQTLDLQNFKNWVSSTYQKSINVTEPYMSMTFTLYLESHASQFYLGNIVQWYFTFRYNATRYVINLVWTSAGTGGSNSPISQQLVDSESYAQNVVNITNYNKSIVVYYQNTTAWRILLDAYNGNKMNELENLTLYKRYNFADTDYKEYTYDQIFLSINENIELGDLLSFTIVFGDRYDG